MSKKFAKFVKSQRKKRGLSLRALADASGTGFVNIHDIETGKNANPTVKTLKAVAGGLGINPVDLFLAAL